MADNSWSDILVLYSVSLTLSRPREMARSHAAPALFVSAKTHEAPSG